MSPTPHDPLTELPPNPDLRHLKDQARDLVRSGETDTLAAAQLHIARRYGFASWPKLRAHVTSLNAIGQLRDAIDSDDRKTIEALMLRNPGLRNVSFGRHQIGPLTRVAECRVPGGPPSPERLAIARWMLENGSDVHQGGDAPLMRAALSDDRIPMMELLVAHGADVNARWDGHYPIICAPCETLAPGALAWLLDRGADPHVLADKYGSPLAMVIGTYSRDPDGKHECLEVFVRAGFELPDTAIMAFHRGRLDLLERHLDVDPSLIGRRFTHDDIFPPVLGLRPDGGSYLAPLDGATLLHLAAEFAEIDAAQMLIARGADVNARAAVDPDGFGGHAPLFHCVVTFGQRTAAMVQLLLDHGANPNARATLRKQLDHMRDPAKAAMFEFRNATPIGYARSFQEPAWVNEAAIAAIAARGGTE